MATGIAGAGDGPFVGRDTALATVTAHISAARAGSGGLVLVSGPAGIGKTRLIEEAVGAGPAVVWGRCVDDPGAPPLWPWHRVLHGRPDVAAAVAAALPDTDPARGPTADPEAARFRFVAAAAESLVRTAGPDGLVLVLEDLHWADETSLRLLRHLAGELHRSRLLVVASYRDPRGTAREDPLNRVLPELVRHPSTHTVALGPLREDDVHAYLAGAAPTAAAGARRLHRRSGGNPLFLRLLARQERSGSTDGTTAAGELRHVVRAAVAGLAPSATELLQMAAVLGEEVDATLLAVMVERPPLEVDADLDSAVRLGVLAAAPDAPGRRRFLHAIVRDGVYADLDPGHREALHRRAAEAWERLGVDESAAGIVAGHWLRAAPDTAALRRAAAQARRAAGVATRSLAFAEAAHFLALALEAGSRAGLDAEQRTELVLELAAAEFRAGRVGQSLHHAVEASEAAAACGRADLLAAAALTAHDIESPDFPPAVLRMCGRALAEPAVDRSPALRARLLAQTAAALLDSGRPVAAVERSAEALALAEQCGDPDALMDAVRARMKAAPEELDIPVRLRLGRLAVEHAAASGQPLSALWGHKWRIDAALEIGDVTTAEEEMARVSALARATRMPLIRWHDLRLRASVAALVGRFPEALRLDGEARELAAADLTEDRSAVLMSTAFHLSHWLVTGDPGEAPDTVEAALGGAVDIPVALVSRALVLLLLGRREEAAARYEDLRRRTGEADFLASPAVAETMVSLVAEFGDADTAQLLWDRLSPRPVAAFGAGVYGLGSTAALLGRLAVVLGRPDEAVDRFAEGLTVDTRTGARPAAVHARLGLAGALLARGGPGDLRRALSLARAAQHEARSLGMPGPGRQAAALADRALAALRAADPLTPREREVAALVATALTNRQVAARLVLSERTVESHVRNILIKLGLVNRTQIATVTLGAGGLWETGTGAADDRPDPDPRPR